MNIVIKSILILSFVLYHAFEWYLEYLDTKHMNASVPQNVQDVYDPEEYKRWIAYHKANKRLQLSGSLVSFTVNLVMLLLNFYAFVFDMIKSWVITIILGYGLTVLVMFFYEKFGDPGILLICAAAIGLSLILNLISVPLMRVFNKFEPLEDGTLKEALLDLCTRYGVKVKKIVVRDASRRHGSVYCHAWRDLPSDPGVQGIWV